MRRRVGICATSFAFLVLGGAGFGCAPSKGTVSLSLPAVSDYETFVHPILTAGCATLDCHGNVLRPLQLYSETGLRMSDSLRDQPLTQAEYQANVLSLVGVDPDPPAVDDDLVLTKPLALSAGGLHHKGGELWPSRTDPAYVCVRGWLAGQSTDPAVQTACAQAPQ